MVGVTGSIPVAPTTQSGQTPDCRKLMTKARIWRVFLSPAGAFSVSPETARRFRAPVSAAGIPVPGGSVGVQGTLALAVRPASGIASFRGSREWVGRSIQLGQTEALELTRPFGRSIPEAGNADAARQATLDGSLDEGRSDKGHRDRHIDVTGAALVAGGNLLDPARCPETISSSQARPRAMDLIRAALRSALMGRTWSLGDRSRQQDLARLFRRRLAPRDQ